MNLVNQTLKNRTILVAGSTSMVGWQIACRCAQNGATIIALSRDNGPLIKLQAELLECSGKKHFIARFDLAQVEKIPVLVGELLNRYGKIDSLVHAPGVCPNNTFGKILPKEFERIFQINYLSLAELTRNLLLRENSALSYAIHVSTISLMDNASGLMPYAVCSGGTVYGMHELAKELDLSRFFINCLFPSPCTEPGQRCSNPKRLNLLATATVRLLTRDHEYPSGEVIEVEDDSSFSILKYQKVQKFP